MKTEQEVIICKKIYNQIKLYLGMFCFSFWCLKKKRLCLFFGRAANIMKLVHNEKLALLNRLFEDPIESKLNYNDLTR